MEPTNSSSSGLNETFGNTGDGASGGSVYGTDSDSVADIIRDVRSVLMQVIRSEMKLARLEFKNAFIDVRRSAITFAIGTGALVLGVLPLMAFLVIGLGALIGNYWLSALIWTVVFMGIGGALAYTSMKKMKFENLSLPHSRHVLAEESEAISRHVKEMPKHLRRVV